MITIKKAVPLDSIFELIDNSWMSEDAKNTLKRNLDEYARDLQTDEIAMGSAYFATGCAMPFISSENVPAVMELLNRIAELYLPST